MRTNAKTGGYRSSTEENILRQMGGTLPKVTLFYKVWFHYLAKENILFRIHLSLRIQTRGDAYYDTDAGRRLNKPFLWWYLILTRFQATLRLVSLKVQLYLC